MNTLNSNIKEVLLDINDSEKIGIPHKLIEDIIDIEYEELDNQTKATDKVRDAVSDYLKDKVI